MRIVKQTKPRKKLSLEDKFLREWERQFAPPRYEGLAAIHDKEGLWPHPQYTFHPGRKWAFDYAWPSLKVAVEIHGGAWVRGKHNRAAGMAKDHEKSNEAQRQGWIVLAFNTDALSSRAKLQEVVRYVATILQERADAQARKDKQARSLENILVYGFDPDAARQDIQPSRRPRQPNTPPPGRRTPPKPVRRT